MDGAMFMSYFCKHLDNAAVLTSALSNSRKSCMRQWFSAAGAVPSEVSSIGSVLIFADEGAFLG